MLVRLNRLENGGDFAWNLLKIRYHGTLVGRANFSRDAYGQEVRQMLVVSRKEGEEVVIGDPSNPIGVVRVAAVKGERVRLAFDFPLHIKVFRRELADEMVAQGERPPAVVGKIKPDTKTASSG